MMQLTTISSPSVKQRASCENCSSSCIVNCELSPRHVESNGCLTCESDSTTCEAIITHRSTCRTLDTVHCRHATRAMSCCCCYSCQDTIQSTRSKYLNTFCSVHYKYPFDWSNLIVVFTVTLLTLSLTSTCTSALLKCNENQFRCLDGKRCIPALWKCDGEFDCADHSDEFACLKIKCARGDFRCQNGRCIPETWTCDDTDDCGDRSDENFCLNRTCQQDNHFACQNGQCIPIKWKCDGRSDCFDGSDESTSTCPHHVNQCNSYEFRCKNNRCISNQWLCDHSDDCGDNSDELDCPGNKCSSGEFMCKDNSSCIASHYKCNGERDCNDGSDEVNCHERSKLHDLESHCNSKNDWLCTSKDKCIHVDWICDKTADCDDGSDEFNCTQCSADEILCKLTRECISRVNRCNGVNDCSDGSDEQDCLIESHVNKERELPVTCESRGEFKCNSSGKCLSMSVVCDGNNDCGDWSDEPSNCRVNECSGDPHHCSQICVDDAIGFHCECLKGYKLSSDNVTCEDIDECQVLPAICSGQPCVNVKGYFKCNCLPGYELSDHIYCKMSDPQATSMLFTNQQDIRVLSLSPEGNELNDSHYDLLYTDLDRAVAIDYNLRGNYIIWSEMIEGKIYIGKLNKSRESSYASDDKKLLISSGLSTVEGIAIDYVRDLVYWTDTGKDTIEVASVKNASLRRVLINSNLEEPRSIVIDVERARLFWTDWGDKAKIESSLQDGSERKVIVSTNIIWPNGLTLDVVTKRLYWVDGKLGRIESCDTDGKNRVILLNSKVDIDIRSFSIASYGDNIYWTNPQLDKISRVPKFHLISKVSDFKYNLHFSNSTLEPKVNTVLSDLFSVWVVKIVNPTLQPPLNNYCLENLCSHLCLPVAPSSYKCSCPDGMKLSSNGHSCFHEVTSIATIDSSLNEDASYTHESPLSGLSEKSSKNSDNISSSKHIITVLVAFSIAIALVLLLFGLIIYRNYNRRNITSMNFDNPVYRKTTEEQFALEKSDHDDHSHSYTSSMEPLNQPGTNDFV